MGAPRWTRLLVGALLTALGVVACENAARIGRFTAMNLSGLLSRPRPVHDRVTDPHVPGARLSVIWVGHATVLLQLDDRWILTDPVFTDTIGQVSRRLVEPGLLPEQLPMLDLVLISHLHFDHLSLGSLDLIEPRIRTLVLPEGGAVYVPHSRVLPIELPCGESFAQDGLQVTAVPANHGGWRYALDRAWLDTSATGYVVQYRGTSVYFAGDTAAQESASQAIGERFPGLDLALLPIAPIEPRDYMHRYHIDPAEALAAFELVGARFMVPIHFDTFVNSFDELGDAPRRLRQQMHDQRIASDRVVVLRHGERRVLAWR